MQNPETFIVRLMCDGRGCNVATLDVGLKGYNEYLSKWAMGAKCKTLLVDRLAVL
jgi:hypothetical protein